MSLVALKQFYLKTHCMWKGSAERLTTWTVSPTGNLLGGHARCDHCLLSFFVIASIFSLPEILCFFNPSRQFIMASCFCGSSSHYPVNIYHVYTLFMAFCHKRLFQRNWEPEKNFGMLEFEQISSSMLVYWLCNLKSLLNSSINYNKTLRPRILYLFI